MDFSLEYVQQKFQKYLEAALEYAPRFLGAIVFLLIGLWVIGRLVSVLEKYLDRTNIDRDIRPFLRSFVAILLKVLLLFSVAEMVGIETTSFVAIMAAAGFAIGMALQGSLSNFAAGVMILIFKPYRVGDLVEVKGAMGHVKEVQIFNTIIQTLDNNTTILPNGMAISDVITNLSTKPHIRVDMNVYMPFEEDFDRVEKIILDAINSTEGVMNEPAALVGIAAWESHSIKLDVRPYCKTEDYWPVYYASYRNVTKAMAAADIKVAYSEGVELGAIGTV